MIKEALVLPSSEEMLPRTTGLLVGRMGYVETTRPVTSTAHLLNNCRGRSYQTYDLEYIRRQSGLRQTQPDVISR